MDPHHHQVIMRTIGVLELHHPHLQVPNPHPRGLVEIGTCPRRPQAWEHLPHQVEGVNGAAVAEEEVGVTECPHRDMVYPHHPQGLDQVDHRHPVMDPITSGHHGRPHRVDRAGQDLYPHHLGHMRPRHLERPQACPHLGHHHQAGNPQTLIPIVVLAFCLI